jgi:hypothetical protein
VCDQCPSEIRPYFYIAYSVHCDKVTNLRDTNKFTILYFIRTLRYVAPKIIRDE